MASKVHTQLPSRRPKAASESLAPRRPDRKDGGAASRRGGSAGAKKRPRVAPGETSEYQDYYSIIAQIPWAHVLTYGDVARLAGRPRSARRVGYALSALKDGCIPWWRVVNARGEISARSADLLGACELDQQARLRQEGVDFDDTGRIDLARYRLGSETTMRTARLRSRS